MKRTRTLKSHLFGLTFLAMAFSAAGFQGSNIMSIFTEPGAPPQQGEQLAQDYKIVFPGHTYEVDGVCKMTAEEALCWKPDGSANPELTKSISAAIANMSNQNYRTWTVTVGKKRRTVFLKETRQQNAGNDHGYGQVFRPNRSTPSFAEGWTDYGGSFGNASSNGFDGSYTNWSTVEGVFEKSTKEFPLRYMFQDNKVKTTYRPLKAEKIEVDGNVFEVVSITAYVPPKIDPKTPFYTNYYANSKPPLTQIKLKVVSMKNPFVSVSLQVGDQDGHGFVYVDDKGNAVSMETANQWYQKHQNNIPGVQQPKFPYFAAGSSLIDPMYAKDGYEFSMLSYVPKDKCKTLVMSNTRREMYVFDHIALDPK